MTSIETVATAVPTDLSNIEAQVHTPQLLWFGKQIPPILATFVARKSFLLLYPQW